MGKKSRRSKAAAAKDPAFARGDFVIHTHGLSGEQRFAVVLRALPRRERTEYKIVLASPSDEVLRLGRSVLCVASKSRLRRG